MHDPLMKVTFPEHLNDKIFEIKFNGNTISQIISYFPFSESEKNEFILIIGNSFNSFNSIFSDNISNEQWIETRAAIKKKFQNELFNIDDAFH